MILSPEQLTQVKTAKREYHRKWRATHPENVKQANLRYWMRKIEKMKAENAEPNKPMTEPKGE